MTQDYTDSMVSYIHSAHWAHVRNIVRNRKQAVTSKSNALPAAAIASANMLYSTGSSSCFAAQRGATAVALPVGTGTAPLSSRARACQHPAP